MILFTLILLKNFYQCLLKYILSTLYVGQEIINKIDFFHQQTSITYINLAKDFIKGILLKIVDKRNIKDTECWIRNHKLNKSCFKCYMKNYHKRYLPCLDKNTL